MRDTKIDILDLIPRVIIKARLLEFLQVILKLWGLIFSHYPKIMAGWLGIAVAM